MLVLLLLSLGPPLTFAISKGIAKDIFSRKKTTLIGGYLVKLEPLFFAFIFFIGEKKQQNQARILITVIS